ncbi:MAG TPA: hypothetical protein VGO04_09695 [Ensifer sp.]|jgi:hypothetical protein|uniref:hypothetical protein n=1 Tax=Ensifer sp. TaxID=1872086 RepID=UPI002E10BE91|nr:hypothetical protein [Ensifer sp.]
MSETGPIIFGMTVDEFSSLVRRATREAVRENLRAGIPVTGMVNGVIREIHPTDALALELLKNGPTSELPLEPKA